MELYYDDIVIKRRRLISGGTIVTKPESITLIHGESGLGKSLLLRNIIGNKKNVLFRIVLMDQSNKALIPSMDVIGNIAMSTDVEVCNHIRRQVEKLGFGDVVSKDIKTLSGGESRIVCALRCIFSGASVILMDEPTNDLDYDTVERLVHLLCEVASNKCIIVITHDDRLDRIADVVYEVKGGSLIENAGAFKKNHKSVTLSCNIEQRNISEQESMKLVRIMFPVNIVSFFFAIILIAGILSSFLVYCVFTQRTKEKLPPNQIFLTFKPISSWASLEGSGGEFILADHVRILMSVSPREQLKAVNKIFEEESEAIINICSLNLDSTDFYDVYPLEYCELPQGGSIDVLDVYGKRMDETYSASSWFETTGYFELPGWRNQGSADRQIELNKDVFYSCAKELEASGRMCVAAYVVMKPGHTPDEFFASDEFEKLSKYSVSVLSEETIERFHEVLGLSGIIESIPALLLELLAVIAASVSMSVLYLSTLRERIKVCCNYGIASDVVYDGAKTKLCNRWPLLIPLIVFSSWYVLRTSKLQSCQMNWIYLLYLMVATSIVFKIQNGISRVFIRREYRWDVR